MKRMHVHLAVDDLQENIGFYSALFAAEPTVVKDDYAKWQLEDPRVNFAISSRGVPAGLEHLGLQVESAEELAEVESRLARAEGPVVEQTGTACCYARSDKYWIQDPQGIAWESFHTLDEIPTFNDAGAGDSACCTPDAPPVEKTSGCCAPAGD
jgi:catechol 2,3-dioxygenase-like lactoylglutathione lyase family enzyme